MNWFTGIVTFLTMWWIVLFCVLPIGVQSQSEAGHVIEGTDPGAPVAPNLKKKMVWTTIATAVLWCILAAVIHFDLVSLEHPLGKFGAQ